MILHNKQGRFGHKCIKCFKFIKCVLAKDTV